MGTKVRLNTTLAGPEIGPFAAGTIVELDDGFASKLIDSGQAVRWTPEMARRNMTEAVGNEMTPEKAIAPSRVTRSAPDVPLADTHKTPPPPNPSASPPTGLGPGTGPGATSKADAPKASDKK